MNLLVAGEGRAVMNMDTWALIEDATDRVERAIRPEDCPTIVRLRGERSLFLSDYDYPCGRASSCSQPVHIEFR
jgi:hypothetical protein